MNNGRELEDSLHNGTEGNASEHKSSLDDNPPPEGKLWAGHPLMKEPGSSHPSGEDVSLLLKHDAQDADDDSVELTKNRNCFDN